MREFCAVLRDTPAKGFPYARKPTPVFTAVLKIARFFRTKQKAARCCGRRTVFIRLFLYGQTEKPSRVFARQRDDVLFGHTQNFRRFAGDKQHVCGNVSFSAVRFGRHIGTVGFDKQTVFRNGAQHAGVFFCVLNVITPLNEK